MLKIQKNIIFGVLLVLLYYYLGYQFIKKQINFFGFKRKYLKSYYIIITLLFF